VPIAPPQAWGGSKVTAVQKDAARALRGRCCAGASQLCSGCASFFGWLWSLEPAVKGWIRRKGAPGAWVDDIASEVFTVAWRRLDVVPGDRPEAERWLFAVARRALSNQRRALEREARRVQCAGPHRRPGAVEAEAPG
jgi:DNA-directed RNA polymerase specialized sigma24 family protein